MQTGIYYWIGYPLSCEERFRMIKNAGFDNVMLWWGDEFIELTGPKEAIPDLARSFGLNVENVHLPYEHTNLLWLDTDDSEEIINRHMNAVDGCASQGIDTMVLHITSGDTPPPVNETGLNRLSRLFERAENLV